MSKLMQLRAGWLGLLFVLVAGVAVYVGTRPIRLAVHRTEPNTTVQPELPESENAGQVAPDQTFSLTEPDSPWVIVNKQHLLPSSYAPNDLTAPDVKLRESSDTPNMQLRQEAAGQLEKLFAAASQAGHSLLLASGYRSYATQRQTYNNYVAQDGQAAADRYSAKPGASEHQAGWAADLATTDWKCYLEICFGQTAAGQWLDAHADEFGFIIRYQDGKEAITGYQYEPWHLRYVGTDLASKVTAAGQVLEEYFHLSTD